MNKRIRELALLGWKDTSDQVAHLNRFHNRSISQDEITDIFEQKFAELIVKECAELVDTLNESYGAPSTGGKFIKKHFGVEE